MKSKVIALTICSCCHKRIKNNDFLQFEQQGYVCSECYIENFENYDLYDYTESDIHVVEFDVTE